MKIQFWKISITIILVFFLFANCLKAKRSPFDFNGPSGFGGIGFLYLTFNQNSSNFSIVSSTPASDATGISITNSFSIVFNLAIKADSLTTTSIILTDTTTNTNLPLTYSATDVTVAVSHNPLVTGRKYQLTVKGGDSGVTSTTGKKLSSDYSINFTTASSLNYSGPNGMNFNSSQNAKYPYLISRNSKLYAFWSEIDPTNYQLKGREIDFTSNSQVLINNTGGANHEHYLFPINYNSNLYLYYNFASNQGKLTKFNSNLNWTANINLPTCAANSASPEFRVIGPDTNLYLIQDETGCYTNRVVRVYNSTNDGTSWNSIVGSNNYDRINGSDVSAHNYPDIIYFNSNLYATFVGGCDSACSVKFTRYMGTSTWSAATTISDTTSNVSAIPPYYSRMFIFNNKLYIVYTEVISTVYRLRVKVFNGNTASPAWTAVDNSTGINFDLTKKATRPFPIVFNSNLYIIWSEENSTTNTVIRMKAYNGNDSAPSWSVLDGGGEGGFNIYSTRAAFDPALAEFNGKLYGIWTEASTFSNVFLVQLPL